MTLHPDEFTAGQIRAQVDRALHEAGVSGIFPTPLEAVATAAGVREFVDIADVPQDLIRRRPNLMRRIVGAYLYRSETLFVDRGQMIGKERFIIAHETGHRILPWHRASHHLDDDRALLPDIDENLEAEANYAAGLLIFQGGAFHQRALSFETSLRTPLLLAPDFGASLHASIRYFVLHHPEPVAVLVCGRHANRAGRLPVFAEVQSASFQTRFASLRNEFPLGVPVHERHPIGELVAAAFATSGPIEGESFNLTDVRGRATPCTAEAFENHYNAFLFVTPRRRVRVGRRITVAS